jgi:hypothetical protein
MNKYDDGKYKRISKAAAKKLFEQGKTFYIQSCNMRPENVWQSAYEVEPQRIIEDGDTFTDFVNSYRYYNSDHERGYYPAFYIRS